MGEPELAQEGSSGTPAVQSVQTEANPRSDVRVYIGPTIHRRTLIEGSVFRGGLNAHVAGLIAKIPELGRLIVPLSEVAAVRRRAKEPGTEEHRLCQHMLTIRFNPDGEVR